ncbi:Uncharacterised protein [Candidatus Venteria ishoeyi]|uniref:Uncharacterized protein n=1 Tax=Candidatus Venteria ishoeyi TaxID=1899563 RepID=A0A1H6F642_9GAMM|nr:Uncharacterised protein [Candidatus Venteria ishoeyi]
MNSQIAGNDILDVEITNISSHGIWLFTENQEFLCPMKISRGSRMQPLEMF